MLPRNIDLTLNRDFTPRGRNPIGFHIRQFFDNLPDMDSPFMTSDEYDALSWYESIFGRRRHINEAYRVFGYEHKHEAYWRKTCVRCGKPLRVPWKNKSNLCDGCERDTEIYRCPWKGRKNYEGEPVDMSFDEIFALR